MMAGPPLVTTSSMLEAAVPWSGLFVSVVTTTAFTGTCRFLQAGRLTQPTTTLHDRHLSWRWINLLISFVHSLISGLWTLYCVLTLPALITDMISVTSRSAYFLASFSHGYFVYDLMEMVKNVSYRGSGELVVHHIFVITCLTISVLHCQYLGFACTSLAVEVSNVFLHSRTLLKIAGRANGTFFSIHRWINLGFFVIFRLLVLLFLVNSMFKMQSSVPHWVFCAGTICGIVVLVLSAFLLYRLIRSDFGHVGDEDGRGKVKDDHKVGSAESNGCMTGTVAAGDQMSAASDDPNLEEPGSVQHSLSKKIS